MLNPATIAVTTSGAPLPNATKVTPAKFSEHFKNYDSFSIEADVYFSEVDDKKWKARIIKII